VNSQQAQAAPASPRLRSLASFDFLGSEAFASHLSKSPAADSRPPELAADPELDPSAALLLRVSAASAASDLRPDPSPSRIVGREGEGSTPSTQDQGGPIAVEGQQAQSGCAVVPKASTASTAIHSSKDLAGHLRPPALTSDLRPTASHDAIAWREGESDSHEGEGSTPSTQDQALTEGQAGAASEALVTTSSTANTAIHTSKDPAGDSRPPEPTATPELRLTASRDAIAWREGESDSHPKATKSSTAIHTSKDPAGDSRPPEPTATPELRSTDLNAPSGVIAGRKGGDARSPHAALLPVGGEDVTHTQEENH
jgi:hypothetical protein